jgi:hypothetical protein
LDRRDNTNEYYKIYGIIRMGGEVVKVDKGE